MVFKGFRLGKVLAVAAVSALATVGVASTASAADGKREIKKSTAPEFPRAAERRGIEGFVVLEYTVLADGQVENPVVVEANPEGIFDSAAIKAVSKWKYTAADADTPGVKMKISFKNE